ncbi:unnamed protein product [Rhizophagus irregularis]|nr:unnamed protein product [Rhizophagus irregularis]
MVDCDENGKNDVICICTQSISKQDWQDHQIYYKVKKKRMSNFWEHARNDESCRKRVSILESKINFSSRIHFSFYRNGA